MSAEHERGQDMKGTRKHRIHVTRKYHSKPLESSVCSVGHQHSAQFMVV